MVRLLSWLVAGITIASIIATPILDSSNTVTLPSGAAYQSRQVVSFGHSVERRKGGGGHSGGGHSSGARGGNSGGSRSSGSGSPRSFGHGGFYGGGAAVPYLAGSRTPKGLPAAPLLVYGVLLAIMPGDWLCGVYPYHFNIPYHFYNSTAHTNTDNEDAPWSGTQSFANQENGHGANETLPVICLCQEFSVCSCDENDDPSYIGDLVRNGSYGALNKTLVTVSYVDNKRTLILNGTLSNGTTAPGGTQNTGAILSPDMCGAVWFLGLLVLLLVAS
jgi:hypothetical protein